jgi:hypothetical protein
MIPSQPVFALTSWFCVLSGEVTNTSFVVFGFDPIDILETLSAEKCLSDIESGWFLF